MYMPGLAANKAKVTFKLRVGLNLMCNTPNLPKGLTDGPLFGVKQPNLVC